MSWLDEDTLGYWTGSGEVGALAFSSGEIVRSLNLHELAVDVRDVEFLLQTKEQVVLIVRSEDEARASVHRVRFADLQVETLLRAPADAVAGAALAPDERVLVLELHSYRDSDYLESRTRVGLDLVRGETLHSHTTTMPEGRWAAHPEYRFVGDAQRYELYLIDEQTAITSIDCDNPAELGLISLSLSTGRERGSARFMDFDPTSVLPLTNGMPGLFARLVSDADASTTYHYLRPDFRDAPNVEEGIGALSTLPWPTHDHDDLDRRLHDSGFLTDDRRVLSWYEPSLYLWSPSTGAIEAQWELGDQVADGQDYLSTALIHPSGLVVLEDLRGVDGLAVWDLARGGLVGCARADSERRDGELRFERDGGLTQVSERAVTLWKPDDFLASLSMDACPAGLASTRVHPQSSEQDARAPRFEAGARGG
ncbi:MAG: hypothetical protein R3A79_03475 [Nannocystaceae bacterium]